MLFFMLAVRIFFGFFFSFVMAADLDDCTYCSLFACLSKLN